MLSSGIHALPVELLSSIFVLGSEAQYATHNKDSPFLLRPDEDFSLRSGCTASADFQLLVSHVCRHWRQVALRMSCLWTRLHFREPTHILRAEEFLQRVSPNHSLDILVDTVSPEEHIPGINLCREEMNTIFTLITPHVARWRSFHLKVRANECKLIARKALSTCGPAPRLETLQLYHFEDYRTAHNLYIATYRDPVVIFNNVLPSLKNVSLIGVNLPWAHAPYLKQLDALELALHPDNIRPPFDAWDAMLRGSGRLRRLLLHYSGPRAASVPSVSADGGPQKRICVPTLEELSLTDLDPEHLTTMLRTLELPHLATLSMDLPEQDFTAAVRLIASPLSPLPLAALHTLRISALECTQADALAALIRGVVGLRVLELDFSRIGGAKEAICEVFFETVVVRDDAAEANGSENEAMAARRIPVLRQLEEARLLGLQGAKLRELIAFRSGFVSASASCRYAMETALATLPRFLVRWNASRPRRGRDAVLDELVANGKVCVVDVDGDDEEDEEDIDDESVDDDGDSGSAHAGPDTSDSGSADSDD
uniref:F-box domain-containing protein n=1 Tax=Mycena chlorophos TaxID=658473 RepID=A0ABQ0LB64_MYCCL|nr:predicted protein [Mycena chlorophos]